MTPHATVADAERATPLERTGWALLALGAWAVVVTAARLHPDGRGYGTHQQLGLPPCEFGARTGVPCPGCGLTTSFANMAHGRVLAAFASHLMGPALFALVLAVALYGPWALYRGRPLRVLTESRATLPALAVTLTLGMLTAGLRLAHVLPAR